MLAHSPKPMRLHAASRWKAWRSRLNARCSSCTARAINFIPVIEGERLARAASGPTDFVVFEEGNHVCFNISYKFRPLTADWTAEHLCPTAH
jgi:hypothetical protein